MSDNDTITAGSAQHANGQTAAYLVMANRLADQIASLPAGHRLPSEHELAAQHGVSRLTARAAVQELERRFLVTRSHRKGTFVARRLNITVNASSPPSWTELVRRAGGITETRVIRVSTVRGSDEVRDALDLTRNQKAIEVERLSYVDGFIAELTRAWFRPDLAPHFDDLLGRGGSIYKLLLSLGYTPRRLWMTTGLVAVPADVAKHLELEGQPPVMYYSAGVADRKTHQPLQTAQCWMRPDVIQLTFALGEPNHSASHSG